MGRQELQELQDWMCLDYVPGFCKGRVTEFEGPITKLICRSCNGTVGRKVLKKQSTSSQYSSVFVNPKSQSSAPSTSFLNPYQYE